MIGGDITEKQFLDESFKGNLEAIMHPFRRYTTYFFLNPRNIAGPLRPVLLTRLHSLQERSSVWTLLQVDPGLSTPEYPNKNTSHALKGKQSCD